MICSIEIPCQIAAEIFNFNTKPLGKRQQVLYYSTLQSIKKKNKNISYFIIPVFIDGYDYNFELFIEHIRIDEEYSKIPIVVYFRNESEVEIIESLNFSEEWYRQIAVSFVLDTEPKVEDLAECRDANKRRWDLNISQFANKPIKSGRHDQANSWGSFVFSYLLSKSTGQSIVDSIKNVLCEEPFYRKKVRGFESQIAEDKNIARLKSYQQQVIKLIKDKKILIVEDQLEDGWANVYKTIFPSLGEDLLFTETEDGAYSALDDTDEVNLIIVDIRLLKDRSQYDQNEGRQKIKELSGVKISKWVRNHPYHRITPIVAATASNKCWTLEALLEEGVNHYWVKGSPEVIDDIGLAVENVSDFYRKIIKMLEWSKRTEYWQKTLFHIAKETKSRRLNEKAKSLQVLLFKSPSPFAEDMSSGLQMNLAFLLLYSCINDLVELSCEIHNQPDGSSKWYIKGRQLENKQGIPVVERKRDPSDNKLKWYVQDGDDNYPSIDFPDTAVAKMVLINKKLYNKQFIRLKSIRNGLPLIHGKIDHLASSSSSVDKVEDKQIDNLTALLNSLADNSDYNKSV